ncbi:MAG: AAA family ATPase [Opitutaceae bacterium]
MSQDLDALRLALQHSPDNIPLNLLLANGCIDEGFLEEASEIFQKLLQLDPNNIEAKLGSARVSLLLGKLSQAAVRAEQILQQNPNSGEARILLARIFINEGDYALARDEYAKALQLNPSLQDSGIEADLATSAPPEEPQRAGVTADGSFHQSSGSDDDTTDLDNEPRGGEAFDLGLSDFERPKLNFSGVGGMEALKEEIRMKILYPMQHADLFKAYDKKIGGGVLLYGPPGCGKTLISKATAGEIKANFMAIGLHQILDMWIGNSEKNMHSIFELARKNAPCVLFFDEVDALAADRRDLRQSAGRNLINAFLSEMDGAQSDNEGVLILGATNAPWHLDPAFRRPGRFDRTLFVPPPDAEGRASIIDVMRADKPIGELDNKALAKKMPNFSGADIKAVFDLATEEVLNEAMKSGKVIPLKTKNFIKAAKKHKPTTASWFDSAKNYALYSNQGGIYDEVLQYLGLLK